MDPRNSPDPRAGIEAEGGEADVTGRLRDRETLAF